MSFHQPCPCDRDASYLQCCGVFHQGTPAPSAVALMRSRYTAFVVGDVDYLFRTWHPKTRPHEIGVDPATVWQGLVIHRTEQGLPGDDVGVVEFTAMYQEHGRECSLHETSSFARRGGRWVYVDQLL